MLTINHPITGKAHTLFPHNGWSLGTIPWKRQRQTGVGTGILGNENRASNRSLPLQQIMAALTPINVRERSRMDARVDQAKKSGLACSPFFGRGFTVIVSAAGNTNQLTLSANPLWTWQPGDVAILIQDDLTFDSLPVQAVAGNILTLTGNLTNSWPTPAFCWPLIFGMFTADDQTADSGHLGPIKITIAETVSARNAQLGVVPGQGPAIPNQQVEESNDIL